jgi:hypothetical protein
MQSRPDTRKKLREQFRYCLLKRDSSRLVCEDRNCELCHPSYMQGILLYAKTEAVRVRRNVICETEECDRR